MPDITSFSSLAQVPVSELTQISESQVLNSSSQLYAKMVKLVVDKWAALEKARASSKGRRKTRVYVPYVLTATEKYNVAAACPQFDINYAAARRVSAAFAQAVSLLVSEVMLTLVGKQGKKVLLVGYQLRPALLRNREWVRLYIPSADPSFQASYRTEDRELASIYASMAFKNKRVPDVLSGFMTKSLDMVRPEVFTDSDQANVSCFVLDKLDTNFRQLANWMHRHGNKVLYFSIPSSKEMEYATHGHFDELNAYVVPRGDKITLMFKDDLNFQRDYTHANYMELIARTKLVMHGKTFVKEFVDRILGYAVYKITCFQGEYTDTPPVYRSWNQPDYRNKVMLYVPTLRFGGSVCNRKDWMVKTFVVDAELVHSVSEMAMVNSGPNMDAVIARRLNSKAHNYITSNQLTRKAVGLTTDVLEAALMAVYVETFMSKFKNMVAVTTLAPGARQAARLPKLGILGSAGVATSSFISWIHGKTLGNAKAAMRGYMTVFDSEGGIQLPRYMQCPGFTEYGDNDLSNPVFNGWINDDPTHGFSPYLPGKELYVPRDLYAGASTERMDTEDDYEFRLRTEEKVPSVVRNPSKFYSDTTLGRLVKAASGVLEAAAVDYEAECEPAIGDAELRVLLAQSEKAVAIATVPDPVVSSNSTLMRYMPLTEEVDGFAVDEISNVIVDKMFDDHVRVQVSSMPYVYNAYLCPRVDIDYAQGAKSDDPIVDLSEALSHLYPNSQLMDVSYIEAERVYNPFAIMMRTIKTRVDMSKLEPLKPESFYLPAIRSHVVPKIKETTYATLATLAKRNADTPYVMDPSSAMEVWNRSWKAMLKVYFVPGTEEWLKMSDPIMLDELSLREWLIKQAPAKLAKLVSQDDYSMQGMSSAVERMNLMLKTKLKPELDNSYETSVKLPQSIQYDNTGRTVAMLSPLIRQKVKREQTCLKPNVLVMQRKSRDNIVDFLNQFDHRPNELGTRYYIEVDQTMFDKAQLTQQHDQYMELLRVFGVSEEYIQFIDAHMNKRTVSSAKAGVAADLEGQNASGAAYTLDRNNGISMVSLAELIETLNCVVEFVLVMGDDVTLAVRGYPDVSNWERDLSRRFNLNPKVMVREHGSFCSFDIVHLPGGRTVVVRDIVKAALGFADLSLSKIEDLHEKWISYVDSMRDVDNSFAQVYLIDALYKRWVDTHPGAKRQTFDLLLRVHTTVKSGFEHLRRFQSTVATVRHY